MDVNVIMLEYDERGNNLDRVDTTARVAAKSTVSDLYRYILHKINWSHKTVTSCYIEKKHEITQKKERFHFNDSTPGILDIQDNHAYSFIIYTANIPAQDDNVYIANSDFTRVTGGDTVASHSQKAPFVSASIKADVQSQNGQPQTHYVEEFYTDVDDNEVLDLSPATSNEDVIELNSNGLKATLGEFYDRVQEKFCHTKIINGPIPIELVDITTYGEERPTYDFITNNNVDRKLDFMKIGDEFLSIVGGLIKPLNFGLFLTESNKSEREVTQSFLFTQKFQLHQFDFKKRPDLAKSFISVNNIDNIKATHFVTAIESGIVIPVTVKAKITPEMEEDIAENRLKQFLLNVKRRLESENFNSPNSDRFLCKIFTDKRLPETINEPIASKDLVTILESLIKQLKAENLRRGMKLFYHLAPISELKRFHPISPPRPDCYVVPENYKTLIIKKYIELRSLFAKFNDVNDYLDIFEIYLNEKIIKDLRESMENCKNDEKLLERKLGGLIKTYHKNEYTLDFTFDSLLEEYNKLIKKMEMLLDVEWKAYMIKIVSIDKWKTYQKFKYVGKGQDYLEMIGDKEEVYVLFATWREIDNREDGELKRFEELLEKEFDCVFVDQDVTEGKYPNESRICQFKNGALTDADYLNRYSGKVPTGIARSFKKFGCDSEPPDAVQLEIPCPKSFEPESCNNQNHFWYCEDCEQVYFIHNKYIYCECGRASAKNFKFRCPGTLHGPDFVAFKKDDLRQILDGIKKKTSLNILVIGNVGVGKTTWLNAFANYLTYPSLEKARKGNMHKPIYLVPFYLPNDDVQVGEETTTENLTPKKGKAGTKFPRTIIFETKDLRINFIDTPGLRDPDGVVTDLKNVSNIAQYLSSNFEEIHAITIVLKPNQLHSDEFKYSISEILANMPKKAVKNIIFSFTNARPSNFNPNRNDLIDFLNTVRRASNVEFALNNDRVYAMDNEVVRYIYTAGEKKVKFDQQKIGWFNESWTKSQAEIARLITYARTLRPLKVSEFMSINAIRKALPPLYCVYAGIDQIKNKLVEKNHEVSTLTGAEENLKDRLQISEQSIHVYKFLLNFSGIQITNKEDLTEAITETKNVLQEALVAYQNEKDVINETLKKLGGFLKAYAILPYNDSGLVEKEAAKEQNDDLGKYLSVLKDLVQIFPACSRSREDLSVDVVNAHMEPIFTLKKTGQTAQRLYEDYTASLMHYTMPIDLGPENYRPDKIDLDEINEEKGKNPTVFAQHAQAPRVVSIETVEFKNRERSTNWDKYKVEKFWYVKGEKEWEKEEGDDIDKLSASKPPSTVGSSTISPEINETLNNNLRSLLNILMTSPNPVIQQPTNSQTPVQPREPQGSRLDTPESGKGNGQKKMPKFN